MDPLAPFSVTEALRKKTDLMNGTQNETIARSMVAVSVTIKPGVAGRMQLICPDGKKRITEAFNLSRFKQVNTA